ncbi:MULTISPECIES: GntR family transcriptional regulator [unclassified Burkholderia]|uniref:GntR family transcriptional regulator n=1 Tax=unclassified Burkholderia TaxID=2613784 RepID=UPI00046A1483|nr:MULTISPECIES: GntR family transcriptional regulator [unclassified Burkholderia]NIE82295.1 GntR family transcriptional regulator [Burkholderia sp. Tr-860]NIF62818.1 GntR family transcriptional regulator [Burkholderia sp. Cy-647]NIF71181.1 GntR family transcriptional regulator [Burkholderia sp. Ap-962]NIF94619.1 GntR family transcriptional regulator [Burkholderia sp. Ax-1720]
MNTNRQVVRPVATLRQQVIDGLRSCISDLTFKPGDRLIERELCEMLGVSRTLVREALSQLVAEGLVQIIPHKGPIVAVMTGEEAKGLYEVRAVLEALAGRQFTERASKEQRLALKQALKELAALRSQQGQEGILSFLKQKARFYDVMLEGAGNPVLTEMLRLVHARVMMLRATTLSQAGRLPQSYEEISAIVDAVLKNDADAAAAACKRHVEQAEKLAVEVLAVATA